MKIINNGNTEDKATCELTLAQAPVIKGLRLGMTAEEMLSLFPGSGEDAEVRSGLAAKSQFGTSSIVFRPDRYESKERFAGISQILVSLLDGRASKFYFGYNGPEYSHVDKFVTRFSEGSSLPAADAWEAYVGMDTQLKTLKCKEFVVRIFAGGKGGNLNYAEIRDLEADKELKDRRAKAKAKAALENKAGQ